jgi:hypothetical protein
VNQQKECSLQKQTLTILIFGVQLVFTAETVAAYLVGAKFQGLTNSYMTDAERANIDPNSREHYNRVWGSKIQVIGWSFYACILWSLKFCVTAFYGRLTYALQIENAMDGQWLTWVDLVSLTSRPV